MPSTLTIQQTVNIASTYTELIPLVGVGGISNEPALTIANETLNELLGEKHPWKFNRKDMNPLFTMRNRQDYQFAGACAFGLGDAKGVSIGLASNNAITESSFTVTVVTLDPHNFVPGDAFFMTGNTVAAYNSTFTQTPDSSAWSGGWTILATPTSTSFTFTHASSGLAASGAAGISDFGWLEYGIMVDPVEATSPQSVKHLQAVRMIQPVSMILTPTKIAVITDLGTGVLKIRLGNPTSVREQITLTYQAKAPLLTLLSATWSPFPDELSHVYRQMFIAQSYRFANSPRSEVEYQKAQANIQKALGEDDRENSDEYIVPSSPIDTFGVNIGGYWL